MSFTTLALIFSVIYLAYRSDQRFDKIKELENRINDLEDDIEMILDERE